MNRNFRSRIRKLEKITQQPFVQPDLFLVRRDGVVEDPDSIPIKVYTSDEITHLRGRGVIIQIDRVIDWKN